MKYLIWLVIVLASFSASKAHAKTLSISGSSTVCVGRTTTLRASSFGGTWQSATPAVATITSNGVVTGISAGTTTISYKLGSQLATKVVTMNGLPSVGVISGASAMFA